jgi:hypothetical protein
MTAPVDRGNPSRYARVRFRCQPCGADYRPQEDRWTGVLSVETQWAAYSAELGALGWIIRRQSKAPFDMVLHCPKCDAASAAPLEQAPEVGRHPG